MNKQDYIKLREIRCYKNSNHKYRTNKFGATFCVICGLLGGYNTKSQPLKEEDKICVS